MYELGTTGLIRNRAIERGKTTHEADHETGSRKAVAFFTGTDSGEHLP